MTVCLLTSPNCANCDAHPSAFEVDPPHGIVGLHGNRFCGEDCAAEYEERAALDQARRDMDWCPSCGFDNREHDEGCQRDAKQWRRHARCRGLDPNLFFAETTFGNDEAKKVCALCPVREPCLEWALRNLHGPNDQGVFGGTTRPERMRLRRQRGG